MKKTTQYFLAMLAVVLFGFSACTSSTDDDRVYGDWDEDRNASLDDREFSNAWGGSEYYSRWDTNNDGFVDEAEWTAGRDTNMQGYDGAYGDWDNDADNRLSEDEFREGIYGFYDRDGDRMINEEEYNSWYGERREP